MAGGADEDGGKERDAALRETARYRGFRLLKSRRRKPGGDFGRYALHDAGGQPVFGVEDGVMTASAEDIEDFLRDAIRATWSTSEATTKARPDVPKSKPAPAKPKPAPAPVARPAPKPKPEPAPPPKPRFKPEVANLLTKLPAAKPDEDFAELLTRPGFRLERIVSRGQATPADEPMVQDRDEWVLVLEGRAGLRVEDSDEVQLGPGDHLRIEAGQKHWVTWTAKDRATVWLALHFD
ncbi:MAG: cupin domain-containing protein [Sphingomonas sp.]